MEHTKNSLEFIGALLQLGLPTTDTTPKSQRIRMLNKALELTKVDPKDRLMIELLFEIRDSIRALSIENSLQAESLEQLLLSAAAVSTEDESADAHDRHGIEFQQ